MPRCAQLLPSSCAQLCPASFSFGAARLWACFCWFSSLPGKSIWAGSFPPFAPLWDKLNHNTWKVQVEESITIYFSGLLKLLFNLFVLTRVDVWNENVVSKEGNACSSKKCQTVCLLCIFWGHASYVPRENDGIHLKLTFEFLQCHFVSTQIVVFNRSRRLF